MLLYVNDKLDSSAKSNVSRLEYLRIPVLFGDSVQATKHDGKDFVNVLLDEAENVLVIPEVQCSLCYLRGQRQKITFHCM